MGSKCQRRPTKKRQQKIVPKHPSDNDENDDYDDVFMSNIITFNANNQLSPVKPPTENRISIIKNVLDKVTIKPMVNFDYMDTEAATDNKLSKAVVDAKELFATMNVKLSYIKSGTTGHTFKAVSKTNENICFVIKVCAYPKDDYGEMTNESRPENAEIRMIRLLSHYVVNRTSPHFVLPICTFNTDIKPFVSLPNKNSNRKNVMYRKFIRNYIKGKLENQVSVLVLEWCNGGDLLDYIRQNYAKMKLKDWTIIFFQILFSLTIIHKKFPKFRHNDMKTNNIMVHLTEKRVQTHYRYNLDDKMFIIPDIQIQAKICDFDFSCIDGIIENNKVNAEWTNQINISKKENKYYDMNFFFNTLINERFFPEFYKGGAPQEIINFVHRVVPEKYRVGSELVNEKGRILVQKEYTTPYVVIMNDPLFAKYRFPITD